MELFFLDVQSGETKKFVRSNDWLNHLLFSPSDPNLLMFCHEGPWHKVDRIWLIRPDGSHLANIHKRTMNMEIAGHEFWSADGQTAWYDLQTPRGEDFWVAGYNVASGDRTWYHLERDEWSVHFNVSPDGKLFCGDGGSEGMVAHAQNGKWINLFYPQLVPDDAGNNIDKKGLVKPGVFRREKLVNMAKHDYLLEPNATFTPDMKWIVFRSNMFGPSQVFAVEVAKARNRAAPCRAAVAALLDRFTLHIRPSSAAASATAAAARRKSSALCARVTERRSRAVPRGTVGSRMAGAMIPRAFRRSDSARPWRCRRPKGE